MSTDEIQYCSWCYEKTTHVLVERNYLTRNEYQCSKCKNFTVQCRACDNMATFKPAASEAEGLFAKMKESWASELCAEHDGTIADFETLHDRLDDLKDYGNIVIQKKWKLGKRGKIAGGVIAGTALFCPLALLAAPGLAAGLGTMGAVGLGSTVLTGAAAKTGALAVLGSGGIAGGPSFVTATGAGLGAAQGAVISNNYFGAVKDFKISKLQDGDGPALIFINGFLCQDQCDEDAEDWKKAVQEKYPHNPYYLVTWESGSKMRIVGSVGKGGGSSVIQGLTKSILNAGPKSLLPKLNPLGWAALVTELFGNPWHTAMVRASMTGILLADLIARTNNPDGFILMGHSLGARVIYYTLEALAESDITPINDVYLLGGAVGRTDDKGWMEATKPVKGRIFNCFSANDDILRHLYRTANAFCSEPIGLGRIGFMHEKVLNKNVTEEVGGHNEHKEKFGDILRTLN